jgi:RimJ/RimL family protein N-acetyltransferase
MTPADPTPLPILRGRLVWLRPIEADDAPALARWRNDGEVAAFVSVRAPESASRIEQEIASITDEQGHGAFRFVICVRGANTPIGTVALLRIDEVNGSAAFDVVIGEPSAWNQGYGTDALEVMTDFGFGELRLHRIWLLVYGFNVRARRSYHKAGFELEGTLRQAIFRRGQWHDVDQMAMLRHEWDALERPRSWELDTGAAAGDAGAPAGRALRPADRPPGTRR